MAPIWSLVINVPTSELMSQDLIYEMLLATLSLADSTIQIWFTITFAIIVAAHFAGSRIGGFIYHLMSGLYGLYALVLITRYISSAAQIFHYRSLLLERGFEPWPVLPAVSIVIVGGTFILLFGGTIATLWFIQSLRKENESSTQ